MNIQKILFPTDFSEFNDAALALASRFAAESGALLYIVHADDMERIADVMCDAGYPVPGEDDTRQQLHQKLEKILPTIPGVKCQHCYLRGTATGEIIKFAEQQGIDLIVMASHGRSGLVRLLMGSTAENVVRQAPCPVLVVKHPSVPAQTIKRHVAPEIDSSIQV